MVKRRSMVKWCMTKGETQIYGKMVKSLMSYSKTQIYGKMVK